MPYNDTDLIWIQDAVEEYDRTRKWLESQRLTHVTFAGDKRVYLRRSELDRLIRTPHEEVRNAQAG